MTPPPPPGATRGGPDPAPGPLPASTCPPLPFARRWRASLAALLLWLTACAGPATPPGGAADAAAAADRHGPPLPARFPHAAPAAAVLAPPAEAQPRGDWWAVFDDPALSARVQRAGQGHADLALAAARVAQARAALQAAEAGRLPQLQLAAGSSRQGGPLLNDAGSSGSLHTVALQARWEPDLLGRAAQGRQAAGHALQAQLALQRSTQLLVQAETAQAVLALRTLDAERPLAQAVVASWQRTLALTETRRQLGTATEAERLQARAALARAEDERLALDARREATRQALALLLGDPLGADDPGTAPGTTPGMTPGVAPDLAPSPAPGRAAGGAADAGTGGPRDRAADLDSHADTATALPPLPQIPPGIPARVLARRPDVAAAQQALLAAQARLGQAQAAWFPDLALTATGGQAAPALAQLLSGAMRSWGVAALLGLPLLDGGRREAAEAEARAQAQAAVAQQRSTILQALHEVDAQLATLQALAARAQQQAQLADTQAEAAARLQQRRQRGLASQLALDEAERAAWAARRLQLQLHGARAQATVALVRALGGGWDDAVTAAHRPPPALAP